MKWIEINLNADQNWVPCDYPAACTDNNRILPLFSLPVHNVSFRINCTEIIQLSYTSHLLLTTATSKPPYPHTSGSPCRVLFIHLQQAYIYRYISRTLNIFLRLITIPITTTLLVVDTVPTMFTRAKQFIYLMLSRGQPVLVTKRRTFPKTISYVFLSYLSHTHILCRIIIFQPIQLTTSSSSSWISLELNSVVVIISINSCRINPYLYPTNFTTFVYYFLPLVFSTPPPSGL